MKSRLQILLAVAALGFSGLSSLVFAEEANTVLPTTTAPNTVATPEQNPAQVPIAQTAVVPVAPVAQDPRLAQMERVRQMVMAKLRAMLTNKDGSSSNIVLVEPLDYTESNLEAPASAIIAESFSKYGASNLRTYSHELKTVTLEEFRKAMAKFDADVMVVNILRNTTFDLYIYDRRTPYYIFAHSEPLPPTTTFPMDQKIAERYVRLLVRRTLFHYARNQYYELPREESVPVLQSEIPRWIASVESLKMVNREFLSKWYAGVHIGAALTVGDFGKVWNSNLIGLNAGYQFSPGWYAEGAFDAFSYNAFSGSVKKMFANKEMTFKITAGLGLAALLNQKTLDFDRTFGVNPGTIFAVPSGSLLYPISDVYLKADAKMFIGITRPGFIFTVSPGLLVLF